MKKDLAFVDFYKKYDISPVRQDISDLDMKLTSQMLALRPVSVNDVYSYLVQRIT